MFELSASEFHRGTLHVEVDKQVSKFRRFTNKIGPIRARVISILMLAFAFFLSVSHNPSKFLVASGYVPTFEAAWAMQMKVCYVLIGLAVVFHIIMGFWKREFMLLDFDKTKSQMRFFHQKSFHYSRPAEGMVPFSEIQAIKVVKQKTSDDSVGYVELDLPPHLGNDYKKIEIALLSDEQLTFYPLNLYRITGITPTGDWKDPEDEPMAPRSTT